MYFLLPNETQFDKTVRLYSLIENYPKGYLSEAGKQLILSLAFTSQNRKQDVYKQGNEDPNHTYSICILLSNCPFCNS